MATETEGFLQKEQQKTSGLPAQEGSDPTAQEEGQARPRRGGNLKFGTVTFLDVLLAEQAEFQ